MAERISANRSVAFDTTTSRLHRPDDGAARERARQGLLGPATTADIDLCAWSNALLGAAETSGGSQRRHDDRRARLHHDSGAPHLSDPDRLAGLTPSAAPPASVGVRRGSYGANDDLRRAVDDRRPDRRHQRAMTSRIDSRNSHPPCAASAARIRRLHARRAHGRARDRARCCFWRSPRCSSARASRATSSTSPAARSKAAATRCRS